MATKAFGIGGAVAAAFLFVLTATAETASNEWKLPEGTEIDPGSLRASADLRYVVFLEEGSSSIQALRLWFPSAYWRLNTKTGELTNVLDKLGIEEGKGKLLLKPCGFSANGKYALVLAARMKPLDIRQRSKEGYTACVLTLEDGSSQKIGEKIASAAWVGNKVVLSRIEGEGKNRKITNLTLVNPADKSTTEMNIKGLIVCGHPDGRMLIYGCDPQNPAEATAVDDLDKSKMAVITTDGKVLRQLGVVPPPGARPDQLILSANGQYVAFREGVIARGRKPKKDVKVRVMTTAGDEEWTIDETATPIGMTDDGRVITVGNVFETEGATVKIRDKSLNSRTLLEHAAAATVVGNQLFYLTPGEQPVIKSLRLAL